ncbi:MAG: isoprenyl transferase [Hyphomicrobiales bacterium]
MSDASIIPIQPEEPDNRQSPRHVAIIMDGNGRWAKERGLPRVEGHRKGVDAVRDITRIAGESGIEFLTLYSFSSENWNRPASEITELFSLLRFFVRKYLAELHQNNVCLKVIGDEEDVPDDINKLVRDAVELTKDNDGLTLVIAFNYGSRNEITKATKRIAKAVADGKLSVDEITIDVVSEHLDTKDIPDPDLIIRTSGEQRLSNFLLWQVAYSEFVFTDCKWPDFDKNAFTEALNEFYRRDRRFGAIESAQTSS